MRPRLSPERRGGAFPGAYGVGVRQYIAGQEGHRTRTFQEEHADFLQRRCAKLISDSDSSGGNDRKAFSVPAGNPATLERPFLLLPEIRRPWKSLLCPCRKSRGPGKAFSAPAGNPVALEKPFLPMPETRQP